MINEILNILSNNSLPAGILLDSSILSPGDFFNPVFILSELINRSFTAFSVIYMPNGALLNTLTLSPEIQAVATNVPGFAEGFSYPLLAVVVPDGAPLGEYELVVAFFDPTRPITGTGDAFFIVSKPFSVR